MMTAKVIAILCSDLHLSEKAPVARAAEPDWFAAQRRPLDEIRDLSKEYRIPVIVAGDIFDRWNASPAIINFALEYLPNGVYAIPGQHDLPNHNINEIKRSAYWTLVEAGKIVDLSYGEPRGLRGVDGSGRSAEKLIVDGFPWGQKIKSRERQDVGCIHLAVMHQYVFTSDANSYFGVSIDKLLSAVGSKLKGYHAVAFGDNHKGFVAKYNNTVIMNCGTLMRRKQDERNYKPQVGLLKSDGTIERHYLDVSEDRFSDPELSSSYQTLDSSEFLAELQSLGGDSLDFRAAILRRLDGVSDDVRRSVLDAVGE